MDTVLEQYNLFDVIRSWEEKLMKALANRCRGEQM